MEEIKIKIQNDKDQAEKICKSLNIHSTDYHYWNGVRCQAEVTLKYIEEL